MRLRVGVVGFTLTLAVAVLLAKSGARPELRWLLAVPFFFAAFGITQALCRTCSVLAVRGLRERDEATVAVVNPEELSALKSRGRRLLLASALFALAAAGLFAEIGA